MKVCKTKYNVKIQSLTFCRYSLDVEGKIMYLTFPQLLHLRQKLGDITAPNNLLEIIENERFVLLAVADKEYLLFLNIPQLLDLKRVIFSYFN